MVHLKLSLQGTIDSLKSHTGAAVGCARTYAGNAFYATKNASGVATAKLKKIACDHLTPPQLVAKTRAFFRAKLMPWSTPTDCEKEMNQAIAHLNQIKRFIKEESSVLRKINDKIDEIELKFQPKEGENIPFEGIMGEIEKLTLQLNDLVKLGTPRKSSEVRNLVKEINSLKRILPKEIRNNANLYRDRALLEERVNKLPEALQNALQVIQHHNQVYYATVAGRFLGPFTSIAEMLFPGGGQVASVALSSVTTATQVKSAKKLPESSTTKQVRNKALNRALCAMVCALISVACLPAVKSMAWGALESAAGNSTRI